MTRTVSIQESGGEDILISVHSTWQTEIGKGNKLAHAHCDKDLYQDL